MPTLRRFLFVGCFLFVAALSFCLGFLGVLVYQTAISPDANFVISQGGIANAILMGFGSSVLTARIGCIVARSILESRLYTLPMILALAGYAGISLLAGGLVCYVLSPYF